MAYSDEPVLVTAPRRWSVKIVVAIVAVAALVGGLLFVPLYQHNLDKAAQAVRRGPHQGALHDITVNGRPHTIELGWITRAVSAVLTPAPAPGTTLEVSGDFGRETLTWNSAENRFGPGKLPINPFIHSHLSLTLREGDRVLWHDQLWAYGVLKTRQ